MGVMTANFSEAIHLACIRSALLNAEHYVKIQNRPMAEWWFDRADYETERLCQISRRYAAKLITMRGPSPS
jgi:hypothetical protein